MEEITLSVVIVNYNVKYFLEQCLYSLRAAFFWIMESLLCDCVSA
jgi:hypothetical protein